MLSNLEIIGFKKFLGMPNWTRPTASSTTHFENEWWSGSRVIVQAIVGLFGGTLNAMTIANVPPNLPTITWAASYSRPRLSLFSKVGYLAVLGIFSSNYFLACEYSRLSSLPAPEGRFARETSAIYSQKFHTDDVNLELIILHIN